VQQSETGGLRGISVISATSDGIAGAHTTQVVSHVPGPSLDVRSRGADVVVVAMSVERDDFDAETMGKAGCRR